MRKSLDAQAELDGRDYLLTFARRPTRKAGHGPAFQRQELRRRWHEEAKSPWLYDAHKGITVVYEDPKSARLKAEYVRGQGLGGVMVWQITSDDDDHSMVQALGLSGVCGICCPRQYCVVADQRTSGGS